MFAKSRRPRIYDYSRAKRALRRGPRTTVQLAALTDAPIAVLAQNLQTMEVRGIIRRIREVRVPGKFKGARTILWEMVK